MIVVTGATGKLGRLVIDRLLDLLPFDQIGASARDPSKVADLARRGVRVRQGDFSEPDNLAAAFEGASQLLLVSSNAGASGGDPLAQHGAAINAAKAAGVRRIVYTSHMGASASSAFPPMLTHAATEVMLRESGIAWTGLRNGFYASTVPMLCGNAATTGVLKAAQDGKISWTAHADLAAGAAQVLVQEGRYEGPTPPLTAAEALDLGDVAAILTALHRRPVHRQVVSDDEQVSNLATKGLPPAAIAMSIGLYRAARAGEFAAIDPTLTSLLGRAPARLSEVMAGSKSVGAL